MNQQVGTGSIQLATPVYIRNSASIVGTKEGEGPLGELFDMVGSDTPASDFEILSLMKN